MFYWFVGKYFDSNYTIPGTVLQPLLNGLVNLDHWACRLFRYNVSSGRPRVSHELAEKSTELMSIHYDMPLGLFESVLGKSMKYSMGLWEEGAETLEDAQEAMLADLCEKAKIEDGHSILDIGCGFGSFAGYALKKFPNSKVYALTMSKVQAAYMRAKQTEPGHSLNSDRLYVIEEDFNSVSFSKPFDRIISIGVFEHVSNMAKGLEKMRRFLKSDGLCLLHMIVYFKVLKAMANDGPLQNPFVDKHIFPGGRIWGAGELAKHWELFKIEKSWELNGMNYRRTLESWVANLNRNWEQIKADDGVRERTLKVWEFYLRGCVGLFGAYRGKYYGNGQYLLRPL